MIVQGFNYTVSTIKEMIDFFGNIGKNLKSKEEKKKTSAAAKKLKNKKSNKKRKQENSDSSAIESSEDSSAWHRPVRKYDIVNENCSHTTKKYNDLRTTVNNYKWKKSGFSS